MGYGGTETEMVRLMNDSGVLKDKISDMDEVTFDQMIEAIHAVQTDLNITGTTANEAAGTIEGSWNSTKAAWANLMVGMADGSQDFDKLMSDFTTSAGNLAKNVIPRIKQVFDKIPELITGLMPLLPSLIQSLLPGLLAGAVSLFAGLVAALPGILAAVKDALLAGIQAAIDAIATKAPGLAAVFQGIFDVVKPIISGLADHFNVVVAVVGVLAGAFAGISLLSFIGQAGSVAAALGKVNAATLGVVASKARDLAASAQLNLMYAKDAVLKAASTAKTIALSAAQKGAAAAQWLVNAAMSANPLGLLVIAIVALIAAFVLLWNKSEAFRNFFLGVWEAIKSAFGTFVSWMSEKISELVQWFSDSWNSIKTTATNLWNALKTTLSNIWNSIKSKATTVFNAIKAFFKTVWNAIKSVVTTAVNGVKTVINTVFKLIKAFITAELNGWKLIITTVWNAIKSVVTTAVNGVKTVIKTVFNAIKTFITTVLNAYKTTFNTVWNAIKTVVTNAVNKIKTTVSTVFNAVKSAVSTVWNGIKTVISNAINGAKTKVSSVVNGIKSTVSSVFNGIKSTASSAWNGIKNAMTSPIESARDKIKGIIDRVKGFFPLSIGRIFSNLSLPHISVSGGSAPFGIGGKGSLPHFNVEWHAKGGIFDQPTLLPSVDGSLHGMGEAGKEAITPINVLQDYVRTAVSEENAALHSELKDIYEVLSLWLPQLANTTLVTDTGALVGAIASKMDKQLGRIYRNQERGRG